MKRKKSSRFCFHPLLSVESRRKKKEKKMPSSAVKCTFCKKQWSTDAGSPAMFLVCKVARSGSREPNFRQYCWSHPEYQERLATHRWRLATLPLEEQAFYERLNEQPHCFPKYASCYERERLFHTFLATRRAYAETIHEEITDEAQYPPELRLVHFDNYVVEKFRGPTRPPIRKGDAWDD